MKEFQYTIQDPMGFHARPAGALVRAAKAYTSKIMISCGEKSAPPRPAHLPSAATLQTRRR